MSGPISVWECSLMEIIQNSFIAKNKFRSRIGYLLHSILYDVSYFCIFCHKQQDYLVAESWSKQVQAWLSAHSLHPLLLLFFFLRIVLSSKLLRKEEFSPWDLMDHRWIQGHFHKSGAIISTLRSVSLMEQNIYV